MQKKGLGVFELTDRLRRAAYLEEMAIKHAAGWFITAPTYEIKYQLGYHAWNHAEHAGWIRERLQFLRGGKSEVNVDPSLAAWSDAALHAPNQWAYLKGAYVVQKAALLEFYLETYHLCDPSANAADRALIRRILPEIEEQIAWANEVLALDPNPDKSTEWAHTLSEMLQTIGGIRCAHAKPVGELQLPAATFRLIDTIIFDERIQNAPLMKHEEKIQLPHRDAVIEQFRVFFNEAYAAAMAASILFEAYEKHLPFKFVHDFTRQFWDEVRHSEFGAIRLKELGIEPDRVNQILYTYSMSMPLLHRVAYLTMILEPHFMPRKKPRFETYEKEGDYRSQLFADHDWSDEINHVKNGREWLDRLLDDDSRSIDDLKEEVHAILQKLSGQEQTTLSPF
jgi:uncharacterized ferritin-like protein (DUF455 family)